MDLKNWIRDVPGYPRPGVVFRDMTPLMAHGPAMKFVTESLSERLEAVRADSVAAIDARGFIFAAPVAVAMGLPFVPLRKAGKLPPEVVAAEYELEYGAARLEVRKSGFSDGQRVAIIDDLLATGGTAAAAATLITGLGAEVVTCAFIVELTALGGRAKLNGFDILSLVNY